MFVGHLGAGLVAKAANRRINLGVLFGAAMLLDAVLWLAVLAGVERMNIPADYAARHYLTFWFPYSHSLLGAALWGGVAGLIWRAFARGAGAGAGGFIVALTVISHWVLDALVHAPELSLWGLNSPMIGLDLWDHQPWALVVEFAVAIAGLALYWRHARPRPWRGLGVAALVAVAGVFTALGAFPTQPPPGVLPIASTSLVIIVIFTLLAGFADRTQGSAP
jgi:hypothetical protein